MSGQKPLFWPTVIEFADEPNITPIHLNRICRSVSGKSAIQLVHQNPVAEAQKYLLYTSYSVSEIAYLLKFEYPNCFAKMFKRYVGSRTGSKQPLSVLVNVLISFAQNF